MVMLRFDEPKDEVLPSDADGVLEDLRAPDGAALPQVVTGIVGFAREFVPGNDTVLTAKDADVGASLFTRTVSIQTILRWDIDDQAAAASPGVVICRGIGGSSSERVAYGLELRVVNAGARIGEVRMFWENLAGDRYTAIGGQFRLGRASEVLMLTAVRRWSSQRDVVVRYYLGDRMLNEAVAFAGEIGGGTTGTTVIGARALGEDHFDGAIDEMRVVGRELVTEEISATWQRIRKLQPAGEQLIRDSMPPGLPISDDLDSRVQREIKWIGQALGYSAAQTENQRANLIPDRAYGAVLQRWERITRQAVRPGDDVDVRRRRVLGHFARRAGVSPPGVRAAMHELLACDEDQLELMAYNNTIRDGFDTLRERRWRRTPEAEWTVAGGALRVAGLEDETPTTLAGWRTCLTGVSGPERIGGYGAQIFAKVELDNPNDGFEVGILLYDWPRQDVLMLGLRRDAGAIKVASQRYIRGVPQPAVVHAVTALAPHWLHLYQVPVAYDGQAAGELVPHGVRWSTTGPSSGFATGDPGDFAFAVGWAGFYARTFDGSSNADPLVGVFDDAALWMPHGMRPFNFYVLRDPDIPGEYDLAAANASIAKLKQSHTHAAVITSRAFLAGNPESLCGRGPLGE